MASSNTNSPRKCLTQGMKRLICLLRALQKKFEWTSDELIEVLTPFTLGDSEWDNSNRIQHITQITIMTAQLVLSHAIRIPCFDSIPVKDKIELLQEFSSDMMMLRAARKYDMKTDTIILANKEPYTRESFRIASLEEFGDATFQFCRKMCSMEVDDTQYALLAAIALYSDTPRLCERRKVKECRDFYIETLKSYTADKRPADKFFASLQTTLDELHTLGVMCIQHCIIQKEHSINIPPFILELWDLYKVEE